VELTSSRWHWPIGAATFSCARSPPCAPPSSERDGYIRSKSTHGSSCPEHLHAVWTLPDGDADYSRRWTLIKRWFSATIPPTESRSASRAAKGERGIWQRRFWEHTLRDPDAFARHLDYVHFNPVKHKLVARASDWPHSSFMRAVGQGYYPPDWAQADDDVDGFGEVENEPD
jgi:REP element-mobilizing transposase RayT